MNEPVTPLAADPHVERLARLFRAHPAWLEAARSIRTGSASRVRFSHVPGEYELLRTGDTSVLRPGSAARPDFAFRFTPESIDALSAVDGGVGEFAVTLFHWIFDEPVDRQIGLRVIASFPRLVHGGYVALVLHAGPQVLRYGARHGITTPGDLRRFLSARRASAARWAEL